MSLEHAKRRVYEDFAKMRARIDKMPTGARKWKALVILEILKDLCFGEDK